MTPKEQSSPPLFKSLEQTFREYELWMEQGATASAVAAPASVAHCLTLLPDSEATSWREKVSRVELPPDVIEVTRRSVLKDIARIRHILSVGGKLVEEEILLLLSLRVHAEKVQELFSARGVALDLASTEADEMLDDLVASKQGNKVRAMAAVLRRRWELPIESQWLPLGK